ASATKDVVAPSTTSLLVPTYVTAGTMAAVPLSGAGPEEGATVTVTAHDPGSVHTATATATVSATNDWATTINPSTFPEGTVTDPGGNPSGRTAGWSTKDPMAPGTPATLSASPSPYVYANKDQVVTVSGTTAAADSSATGLTAVITVSDGDVATTDLTKTVGV